jgi:serine phosphatase RsbU (regulator of sigma subunit)
MKKVLDQIPTQIDAALHQFTAGAVKSANVLRWFFMAMFILAAIWSWGDDFAAKFIYPSLAFLWLMAALIFSLKKKADYFILSIWIDLFIISAGLLLCAWQGVFNAKGFIVFLCYFPVLAIVAQRYNLLLVLQTAAFIVVFYTILSLWAIEAVSVPRLLALGAMTIAAVSLTRKPKSGVVEAVKQVVKEAYQQGAREREAELMARVHEQLFPPTQYEMPGLYTAYKHGVGTTTSGDFYHALETPQGPMIVLGDLPGDGWDAALEALRLQQYITEMAQKKATLSDILTELNSVMWRKQQVVTCVLARWEGASLHYVNAGHLPALHLSKREVKPLPSTAPAIGSAENLAFHEAVIDFPKGDLLLLYTNGAYAGLASDEQHGAQEILRLTEQFSSGEVNTICHRVFDCGQPEYDKSPDDSTVVIARRQEFANEAVA